MQRHTTARAALAALMIAGSQLAHAYAYPIHQAPGADSTDPPSRRFDKTSFTVSLSPSVDRDELGILDDSKTESQA